MHASSISALLHWRSVGGICISWAVSELGIIDLLIVVLSDWFDSLINPHCADLTSYLQPRHMIRRRPLRDPQG